jgi:transposase-like protein
MVAAELWRSVSRLSEVAFREQFGTEEACRAALFEMRWREGLICPACGHHGFCALKTRKLFQCNRCKKQVRLTAGTVFQDSKLPLTVWFLAIYHLTQSKGGISSIELGRRLGVKQPTAWLLKHKLMQAMARRQIKKPKRQGRVESDDARLGGERGRGAAGTTPIVAAVETIDHGASDPSAQQRAGMDARGAERQPRRLKLTPTGQRRPAGS